MRPDLLSQHLQELKPTLEDISTTIMQDYEAAMTWTQMNAHEDYLDSKRTKIVDNTKEILNHIFCIINKINDNRLLLAEAVEIPPAKSKRWIVKDGQLVECTLEEAAKRLGLTTEKFQEWENEENEHDLETYEITD